MDVTLSNDILKQLPAYNGIYQLINLVNGRPSWILEDNNKAIWFSQGRNEWVLGDKGMFLSKGDTQTIFIVLHVWLIGCPNPRKI